MNWNAFGNGTNWDPWREIGDLRTHLDRFFWNWPRPSHGDHPPIEIWNHEAGARLFAQIPGVAPDAVDLSVVGDTVTLKGTCNEPEGAGSGGARTFVRSIRLPFAVDGTAAKARVENGMLDVELPRMPDEKPRKITVKNA